MSAAWNPEEPAKKGVKFDALFRDFLAKLGSPYTKIKETVLKTFIIKHIRDGGGDERSISDNDWASIQRRFKRQFNKYRRTITTFDKNEDGWFADSSLVGKRVSCEFWNSASHTYDSYEGTISGHYPDRPLRSEITRLGVKKSAAYIISYDDGTVGTYNIFRWKNLFLRYGQGFSGWNKLRFLAEPEPCDDPHQKLCTACYVHCVNAVIIPCGHACMCMGCAKRVKSGAGTCPICRGPIQRLVAMYYSGVDNNTEIDKLRAEIAQLKAAKK